MKVPHCCDGHAGSSDLCQDSSSQCTSESLEEKLESLEAEDLMSHLSRPETYLDEEKRSRYFQVMSSRALLPSACQQISDFYILTGKDLRFYQVCHQLGSTGEEMVMGSTHKEEVSHSFLGLSLLQQPANKMKYERNPEKYL
ncbi:uncharacterized protein J5F26_002233 [Ciconia maguari]